MTPQEALELFETASKNAYKRWDYKEQLYFANAYDAFNEHMYESDFEYKSLADIKSHIRRFEEAAMNAIDTVKKPRVAMAKVHYSILESALCFPMEKQIANIKVSVQNYIEENPTTKHKTISQKLDTLLDLISKLKQERLNLADVLTVQFKYKSQENEDTEARLIFDDLYNLALNQISINRNEKANLKIANAHAAAYEMMPSNPSEQLGYIAMLRKINQYKGNDIATYLKVLSRDIQFGIHQSVEHSNAYDIRVFEQAGKDALINFEQAIIKTHCSAKNQSEITL